MQKLAEICIRRPVFAAMLVLALVVVGAAAYFRLGVDRLPAVDLPIVTVRASLPGASPEETETSVTQVLEEAVNSVEGISELRSLTGPGNSMILVTFELNRNIEAATQDVRDRVSAAMRRLPRAIDPPIISKTDADQDAALTIAVSGNLERRQLTELAEKNIKEQLERSSGVGEVRVNGGLSRAINVWADSQKLAAYNLPITAVRDAIVRQNSDVPGGNVTGKTKEQSLRTIGRLADAKAFSEMVIATANGHPIKVKDIGYAEDGLKEQRSISRLNGVPTVTLEVRRQSGANTVAVIEGVKSKMEEVRGQLPPGVRMEVIRDQSRYIHNALHEINLHLVLGSILASLVVLAFMRSWRSTIIAAVAIPTSVVATFGMMWALNFTLNSVTMLALVLMVGVVIDDAIVVLENIFRYVEEKKMTAFEAAGAATAEIGLAVLATTLSLVVIFIPVSFMSSVSGRFLYQFGITAAVSVMVSLLVSFTLTPMMSARLLRKDAEKARRNSAGGDEAEPVAESDRGAGSDGLVPSPPHSGEKVRMRGRSGADAGDRETPRAPHSPEYGGDGARAPAPRTKSNGTPDKRSKAQFPHHSSSRTGFYGYIDRAYTAMLGFSMRHRFAVASIGLLVILSCIPLFGAVKTEFTPNEVDEAEFSISISAPRGVSLGAMDATVAAIDEDVRSVPGVREVLMTAGSGPLGDISGGGGYIRIAPHEERVLSFGRVWKETLKGNPLNAFRGNYSQSDVMQQIRAKLKKYRDLRITIRNFPSFNIGGGNQDIDYVLRGPDLQKLAEYWEKLRVKSREIPGVVDADITLKLDSPELRVNIDRARAADLGVDAEDIGTALRLMVGGDTQVSRFHDESTNRDYDVQLRLTEDDRADPQTIDRLYLPRRGTDGKPAGLVQLGDLATLQSVKTAGRIDRLDRQRSVNFRAGVAPGYALGDRLEAVQQAAMDLDLPAGYSTAVLGKGRELSRTYNEFLWAFLLSIIFMYMILASQFESLVHPLTILLSLPLSVPFALLSLYLTGGTLNLYSALGILVLFGVVKKNSILQIDHMNGLRAKGMPRRQAIMEANRDRLRPILMTTLALVAGMLPLAIGTGPGAEERHAVAVVVIGGQTLSLLLTLLVTPVAYSLFDDLAAMMRRRRGGDGDGTSESEVAPRTMESAVVGSAS